MISRQRSEHLLECGERLIAKTLRRMSRNLECYLARPWPVCRLFAIDKLSLGCYSRSTKRLVAPRSGIAS